MSIHEFYRQSRRAAFVAIAVSASLGLIQFFGGFFGHSVALMSDAVHSLGDTLTSGAVFAALLWAQQPADAEHPYGHTRAEAVAGSNVSLVLVLLGVGVIWEALTTLGEPSYVPEWYTLVIAFAGIVLKEGLYRYEIRVAQTTGSRSVKASAWDHRLDAFGSLTVLVGLALAHWGGPAWHAADHVAACVVGLVLIWTGGRLLRDSLHELLDRQADPETLNAVRREALGIPGVLGVEKLFARKSGLEFLVDIHVEVDPEMSVRDSHEIAHAVKNHLLENIPTIKDVLVHIEPSPVREPARVDSPARDQ